MLREHSITFVEGVINEDVMWTAELFGAARTIYLTGEPLYHYVERPGSVALSTTPRLLDVFDNCSKLESYIAEKYPDSIDACSQYCAAACWNVILTAARGGARRSYPDLYTRSMQELVERKMDIRRLCGGAKDRIKLVLVEHGIYGLINDNRDIKPDCKLIAIIARLFVGRHAKQSVCTNDCRHASLLF